MYAIQNISIFLIYTCDIIDKNFRLTFTHKIHHKITFSIYQVLKNDLVFALL